MRAHPQRFEVSQALYFVKFDFGLSLSYTKKVGPSATLRGSYGYEIDKRKCNYLHSAIAPKFLSNPSSERSQVAATSIQIRIRWTSLFTMID